MAAGRIITKPESGTYALILSSSRRAVIRVGRLGELRVQPGFYVYLGTAFGPGGVRGRIAHHAKLSERPHWHIDFLRLHTELLEVWHAYDRVRREHQWARQIKAVRGSSMPIAGFGSSDCSCESHLYFLRRYPSRGSFQRSLRTLDRDHPPVQSSVFQVRCASRWFE